MGNCFKTNNVIDDYRPLLNTKEAEIESLQIYIRNIQSELKYYLSNKDQLHDKYYELLQYEKKISKENIFLRDQNLCQYCGDRAESVDHIIPKFRGGQHVRVNMCCCCSPCNKAKATSKLEDWYTEENEHYCEERFVKLKQWC